MSIFDGNYKTDETRATLGGADKARHLGILKGG